MNASIQVVTPAHLLDPAPAIAAVRAGEIGLLDLGLGGSHAGRCQAIDRLARFVGTSTRWGVRWDLLGQPDRMPHLLDDLHRDRFPWLLVAGVPPDAMEEVLEQARQVSTRILVESCEIPEAAAAARAGCDGVVLKANEAGGRVSRASSFVLLQRLREVAAPCWLQGAWGPDTAAAAYLAGAAGVVLGEELWLARESPLPAGERERLARFDASETTCWSDESGTFRLIPPVGAADSGGPVSAAGGGGDLSTRLARLWLDRGVTDDAARPLGQGIAFAEGLARRHVTVAGIIQAYRDAAEHHREAVRRHPSITADAPLARDIGIRYPIFQGPMTRVSDIAPFARAVAESGGLPFVALALMRGPESRALLEQVRGQLGERPWGAGILGFVPAEIREEQLAVLRDIRPGFAIIAGGRPRQAEALEKVGISTYLHVPSPGLLRTFLEQGARKFVLEGRECGGHVGPRSSLVLWQSASDVLLDAAIHDAADVHVIFAGGIHDELSSAMVQTLAAPLAHRGVQIGALMGTAYLFTKEAVSTGAITPAYQKEALGCRETVLLASGVGHATRCARTPFADEFQRRKSQLQREGRSHDEVRFELEMLNLGRLRIASKGLARVASAQSATGPDSREDAAASRRRPIREESAARGDELLEGRLEAVDEKTQVREGMYMIGDLAMLRDRVVSMAELHEAVGAGGARCAAELAAAPLPWVSPVDVREPAEPIAVIGMACRFAQSPDLRTYWHNILAGFDAIREVPEERWRSDLYYTSDRLAPDRLYSKWGSFVEEVRFDPVRYGIPPASVASIDPAQLLALDVADSALGDAGYGERPFPRERTAVIFGAGGVNDLGIDYATRTMLPHYLARAEGLSDRDRESTLASLRGTTAPWTEDSFPGVLLNVISGRVANRLDLKGSNYVIDAACASSLAALHAAVQQLRSGTSDMALVGCADASNNPFTFMCFARTHALTPTGRVRPFDDRADGIVLGEGFATIVLKRLTDAERDGDRIYAVIRGIGTSSDGRNRSLTAPHDDAQSLAIERAYEEACIDPSSVGMVEAHATGTTVGDRSEISATKRVFDRPDLQRPFCAVGSVKSMIGHTKTAAGLAGLIKTVLALKNRVLPPTLNVEVPNKEVDFDRGPFWINTETRPWLHAETTPRRAGLSAFGFGGTNFHVVLEEYRRNYHPALELDLTPRAAEIFLWRRDDRSALVEHLRELRRSLGQLSPDLARLACSVHRDESARGSGHGAGVRLGIVATSVDDLRSKLDRALAAAAGGQHLEDASGLYLSDAAPARSSQVAFLLPGQGAQQCHMLQDLVQYGPFGTELFEAADRLLADMLPRPISSYIYPLPAFDRAARKQAKAELDDTRIAQPAIGLVSLFACDVLTRFGLRPAVTAGHSYGEYTALCVAGYTDRDDLLRMSAFRGRAIHEAGKDHPGGMVAVAASAEETQAALDERGVPAWIANINGPSQTVVAGSTEAMEAALAQLREHGLAVRRVAVTAPFHTPAMDELSRALGEYLKKIETRLPRIPVYSNVTAAPYPEDLEAIREQLAVHLARPVRFVEQIRAMHRDGIRVFLEVGPGRILTGLVQRILGDEPHHALALDMSGQPGWLRLGHLLAQTHALGLPVEAGLWFEGRGFDDVSREAVLRDTRNREEVKPTDWVLAPGAVRPAATPAPDAGSVAAEAPRISDAAPPHAAPGDPIEPARSVEPLASSPAARSMATTSSTAGHPGAVSQPTPQTHAANATRAAMTPTPASQPLQTQISDALNKWLDLQREQLRLTERFLTLQERVVDGTGPDVQWPAASRTRAESASAAPTALNVAPAPVLPDLRPTPPLPARDADIADCVGADPAAAHTPPAAAPDAPPSRAETPAGRLDDADDGLPSVDAFRRDLLHEVSQRTGYPEDMLGLDVPLEASLGIDSIKTMEIFAALKPYHSILAAGSDDEEEVLAEFAQMKTLQDIIDRFSSRRERLADGEAVQPVPPATHVPRTRADEPSAAQESARFGQAREPSGRDESGVTREPTAEMAKGAEDARVERLVLRPVSAPVDGDEQGGLLALPGDQSVVILGEAPELASSLEAALASTARGVYRIIPGEKTRRISPHRYEANLSDRAALEELAREIRKNDTTRIGWLINLLSLDGSFREPGLEGQEAPLLLVRWLTNVAQVFEDDLRASGEDGGGYLVNITTLDGHFGLRGARALPVAQAGSLGFFKSLGREWRGIKVRNVDLDPEAESGALVLGLLRELTASEGPLEIGLDGEGRWRLDLVSSPVSSETGDTSADLGLGPESVVLATGGAHGITAAVLELLARETRARLVVVGRSDLRVSEDEDLEFRQIHERSALRARLIERARTQESSPSPAAIERDLQRIERDRAIRANLDALRAAGSEVDYHAVDVRDRDAFGALIDDLYRRYGRVDGALHGAGVVEDRFLRDKTPESVARVFETKANGAQILAQRLRPEGLRFLAFFSSVSGRFGNAGQADYSAANEYLNKLADHLDREWPGRVVSVNWGPWESGMVSDGLRLAYERLGIRLIEAEAGARALLAELGQADSRVPEVILTCSPDRIAELASHSHDR